MTLEERIKQMLAESAAKREEPVVAESAVKLKSLTEDDLDEMTQEEIESIDEDRLDELSKATLGSYIKKATFKAGTADFKHGELYGKGKKDKETRDAKSDLAATVDKRTTGIHKAVNKLTKEGSEVTSQVAALLEAEGLSEDFKLQAVTIFEAAVTDRVLQLTEELEAQYEEKLNEAKAEIEDNIDGFLNESVQKWATDNEVAIQNNFKTRIAESFMDGLKSLLVEHNIDLPAESEDALDIALDQVNTLEESVEAAQAETQSLQEQVNVMKATQILESFKAKMTQTEFDRFEQLTESVGYVNDTQYTKQLSIVLENFGKTATKPEKQEVIVEQVVSLPASTTTIVTEGNSAVNRYAAYMQGKVK